MMYDGYSCIELTSVSNPFSIIKKYALALRPLSGVERGLDIQFEFEY